MQVSTKVMKGCLLRVMAENAVLTISEYCPEPVKEELLTKSNLIVAKLGKVTEMFQGIFFNANSIVMENPSRSKRLRFSWKGDTMVFSNIGIPKAKHKVRRDPVPS